MTLKMPVVVVVVVESAFPTQTVWLKTRLRSLLVSASPMRLVSGKYSDWIRRSPSPIARYESPLHLALRQRLTRDQMAKCLLHPCFAARPCGKRSCPGNIRLLPHRKVLPLGRSGLHAVALSKLPNMGTQ